MLREEKDYKYLDIKLARSIYETLEKFCEENGLTITMATEKILSRYFEEYFRKDKEECRLI